MHGNLNEKLPKIKIKRILNTRNMGHELDTNIDIEKCYIWLCSRIGIFWSKELSHDLLVERTNIKKFIKLIEILKLLPIWSYNIFFSKILYIYFKTKE